MYRFLREILLLIIVFISMSYSLYSQENKFDIYGYFSSVGKETILKNFDGGYMFLFDYSFQNRLNMTYYLNDNLTFRLQSRNQFITGESFNMIPQYAKMFSTDNGYLNLNHNLWVRDHNLMNLQIDRFYIEYMADNWEISLGRQRINWGRSIVWNPNDIFNSFSYYDIDYPEHPGSDALRLRYYYDTASHVEFVMKMDNNDKLTLAGLTKFNKWNYDFQFIFGYINNQDFILGSGWEGNIADLAFRGEFTYYIPENRFKCSNGFFLSTVSIDYSVNPKLNIQVEFLYNDADNLLSLSKGTFNLYTAPSSSRSLSFSEYNIFGNISYLFNPILTFALSGIYYTDYSGLFLMPNMNLSLGNNLSLDMILQYFNLKLNNNRYDQISINLKLKWNF